MENLKLLESLIGIDIKHANDHLNRFNMGYFAMGSRERGHLVEKLIAMLIGQRFPENIKGSDFIDFEVKTIKIKIDRFGNISTCGDTPICRIIEKTHFYKSNTWDKLKSIVSVLIYDDKNYDILYFDGYKYNQILEKDYNNLFKGQNNLYRKYGSTWRKEEGYHNRYLVRKDYRNNTYSAMLKGNTILNLSDSISKNVKLVKTKDQQKAELDKIIGNYINILNFGSVERDYTFI